MKANPSPVPTGTFKGIKFTGVLQASFLHWCDLNGVKVENANLSLRVENRDIEIPFLLTDKNLIVNIRPDVANHSNKRKDALTPLVGKINREGIKLYSRRFIFLFSEYFSEALTFRQLLVHPDITLDTMVLANLNVLAEALLPTPQSVVDHKVVVPRIISKLVRV